MHHTVRLRRIAVAMALATVGLVPAPNGAATQTRGRPDNVAAGDWIQLFNGRDLADWTPKFPKHELGDEWPSFNGEFGHILYKDPFSYYLIAAGTASSASKWPVRPPGPFATTA